MVLWGWISFLQSPSWILLTPLTSLQLSLILYPESYHDIGNRDWHKQLWLDGPDHCFIVLLCEGNRNLEGTLLGCLKDFSINLVLYYRPTSKNGKPDRQRMMSIYIFLNVGYATFDIESLRVTFSSQTRATTPPTHYFWNFPKGPVLEG